jgi:hypothetical protein
VTPGAERFVAGLVVAANWIALLGTDEQVLYATSVLESFDGDAGAGARLVLDMLADLDRERRGATDPTRRADFVAAMANVIAASRDESIGCTTGGAL